MFIFIFQDRLETIKTKKNELKNFCFRIIDSTRLLIINYNELIVYFKIKKKDQK
jgi:hypothetical protein